MTLPAAFFDLDGTLLTVNSARVWLAHQRQQGLISSADALIGIWYTLLYRFAALDMHSLAEKALATMIGVAETEFDRQMRAFFHDTLIQYVPRRAQAVVDEHRGQGHKLVLLTSASTHESRAAVAYFGLDDYICSRFEIDEAGRFTGKAMAPVCYGQGKVTLAEPWAEEHGVDLARSYFYSDSFSDAPMLERVGHPRVVNPDVRLLIMAKRRGWPLVSLD